MLIIKIYRYPVRSCGWGHGAKMFLTATDQVMGATPVISLFKVADDPRDRKCYLRNYLSKIDMN